MSTVFHSVINNTKENQFGYFVDVMFVKTRLRWTICQVKSVLVTSFVSLGIHQECYRQDIKEDEWIARSRRAMTKRKRYKGIWATL
jgi:hypothetical protein